TVYEMKAKRVTQDDIEISARKIASAGVSIQNYIFITTDAVDDSVKDYAGRMHSVTGIEFVILDCMGFLRHFLHLFYRIRMRFLDAYQNLTLSEPDSAVNPALKEAFLSLRLATETGVAQTDEE
ncbi:MAG: DNA methyltransferase, partial [Acidobacteria bacterium]|nr:DNA methyltransferase [Acidobacteriota bacterium]